MLIHIGSQDKCFLWKKLKYQGQVYEYKKINPSTRARLEIIGNKLLLKSKDKIRRMDFSPFDIKRNAIHCQLLTP